MTPDGILERSIPEPNSGCWFWALSMFNSGYGRAKADGKDRLAHRLSYEVHFGPIPPGKFVCHSCDCRTCVNPDHLFLGTQEENMADMVGKKRQTYGEYHRRSKVSEEDVTAIRASNLPVAELAKIYPIGVREIYAIRSGFRWSHSI